MKSIQRELNHFFAILQGADYDIHEVTKGALTQARAKLKHSAFVEMNQAVLPDFYDNAPYETWHGHRLLAVDGSVINLPTHPSVEKDFGVHYVGCNADVKRSMGRVSICYDVLNLLTLDAQLDRFDCSEHILLERHLKEVGFKANDLLLLDRGYPSAALMYDLQQRGIECCVRLPKSWIEVRKMLSEGRQDKEITLRLPAKNKQLISRYKSGTDTVTCRLIVVELGEGEQEFLCTSLVDKEKYPYAQFKALYHQRWCIEEGYKLLKCRVDLEVFSGKTAAAVRQDFYAKIFMMTMCAILSFPVCAKVKEQNKVPKTKHPRQLNRTNALGFLRTAWIKLWTTAIVRKLLSAFDEMLQKTTDIIRPGRTFKRKPPNKKPPSMNYKQL